MNDKNNEEIHMIYVNAKELGRLKNENDSLKEQLENFIPRRRVRRIFKMTKKILEQDGITGDLEDTCLHCGSGEPKYCETCYQDLISYNARLQEDLIDKEDISVSAMNPKIYVNPCDYETIEKHIAKYGFISIEAQGKQPIILGGK